MKSKLSKKSDINLLKEIGYIILLITFFIGIIIGTICFNNVSEEEFNDYKISLEESVEKLNKTENNIVARNDFIDEIKVIAFFWIIGMSVIGSIILIIFIGYKGFSLGYTISAIIKLLGITDGNKYIFQNLFIKNTILVFIMIFLANYSLKIAMNFFINKQNIKIDTFKYTIVSFFIFSLLGFIYFFRCMI